MQLSVLDQSPVPAGSTPAQALHNSIELARLCDGLGYKRYWIAEHHAAGTFASSAPEILMSRIAAETARLRIGSGATLLPYYSPLKVAESFRMLEALYPGRMDLGIGRAPGGGSLEAAALHRGERLHGDDFLEQLAQLRGFLYGDWPQGHPYADIHVAPAVDTAPEPWLLGSSPRSAQLAAQLDLPYAFAHFIFPPATREAVQTYQHYAPGRKPMVALGVVCADTEEAALEQFASTRLFGLNIAEGRRLEPVPTPAEGLAKLGPGRSEPGRPAGEWPRHIVGDPEQVRAQLLEISEALEVEELMIWSVMHDHRARLRSYELLGQMFA
ncbi:LLM class flavin-dependent oxidoreductase [Alkalilimnicola sp. S0819]|uniref:LLM class flavin-dependent oxidoreductase n=1 Tax=Alkalilimnicola sp. S0819 TaxID=2613922 RepID=UPI001261957E|nr:LLM class flavin-dependent oxidoreductase [Alkalilimnicola sp. S0819]KAB7623916.1 LLM class flavin-dependent oxidoreductase [Alkalilimnicola sp. S0819]MPQ16512.1 MsnO8 family LLM class oxidoreductase [Alkalilimnicola sp. S0819]